MGDSPSGLDKWLSLLWRIANCRNGISSWEIHRDLEVTQETGWFMLHRVCLAMQDSRKGGKLRGEVEKLTNPLSAARARNIHRSAKAKKLEVADGFCWEDWRAGSLRARR